MQTKIFMSSGTNENTPFFYIIRHHLSGKIYAGYYGNRKGKRSSKDFLTEFGYQTSSKHIDKMIKCGGLDSFSIDRIRHFENKKAAQRYEKKFLCKVDALNNENFINKTNGNGYDDNSQYVIDYQQTNEFRKRISVWSKGKLWWNNGIINTRAPEKPKGDEWVKGKLISDKMKKHIGSFTEGKVWWNNGETNFYSKENPIGDEWVKGMLLSKDAAENVSKLRTKSVYWNNGIINKMSKTCPDDGWIKGKLVSDKERETNRKNHDGRKFWNNGIINKKSKIKPEGDEWILGFLITEQDREKLGKRNKNTVWWNDGISNKRCKEKPDGDKWIPGFLKNINLLRQTAQFR